MATFGVGWSVSRRAREAGHEAAQRATVAMGGGPLGGVIAVATAGHDQQEVLRGVTDVTGAAPLSGCSTSGIITVEGSNESTHAVAVLTIGSSMRVRSLQQHGLSNDSRACGAALARQIGDAVGRNRLLLLFPDAVTGNITDLLSGLESHLRQPLTIAGGSAGELMKLGRTWQYCDGVASTDSVCAALLESDLAVEIAVSHGCVPIGTEQIVTRAENGWIYEIDGQSAWSVYQHYLEGGDLDALTMAESCYLCLADRLPEPDPEYGEYIIRCPLQLDRGAGALFFPGNIRTGVKVRLALRSESRTRETLIRSAQSIVDRHPGRRPALVMQFDCCCRARLLFGGRTNEALAEPVRRVFGPDVPWFGLSTYGEIAPLRVGGPTRFHNYGAVLCALYPTTGS